MKLVIDLFRALMRYMYTKLLYLETNVPFCRWGVSWESTLPPRRKCMNRNLHQRSDLAGRQNPPVPVTLARHVPGCEREAGRPCLARLAGAAGLHYWHSTVDISCDTAYRARQSGRKYTDKMADGIPKEMKAARVLEKGQ